MGRHRTSRSKPASTGKGAAAKRLSGRACPTGLKWSLSRPMSLGSFCAFGLNSPSVPGCKTHQFKLRCRSFSLCALLAVPLPLNSICAFGLISLSGGHASHVRCKLRFARFHLSAHSGESGIRTHVPFRTNGFQDRLVMTASISLQI